MTRSYLSSCTLRLSLAFLALALLVSQCVGQTSSVPASKLKLNKTLKRGIKAGESHEYALVFQQGQTLTLTLYELGFNAKVELVLVSANETVARADLGGGFEREALTYVARQAAGYLVRVKRWRK